MLQGSERKPTHRLADALLIGFHLEAMERSHMHAPSLHNRLGAHSSRSNQQRIKQALSAHCQCQIYDYGNADAKQGDTGAL